MSKYDPVFGRNYLKRVNDIRRYLSPIIPNESIDVLVNHIKENILEFHLSRDRC